MIDDCIQFPQGTLQIAESRLAAFCGRLHELKSQCIALSDAVNATHHVLLRDSVHSLYSLFVRAESCACSALHNVSMALDATEDALCNNDRCDNDR